MPALLRLLFPHLLRTHIIQSGFDHELLEFDKFLVLTSCEFVKFVAEAIVPGDEFPQKLTQSPRGAGLAAQRTGALSGSGCTRRDAV